MIVVGYTYIPDLLMLDQGLDIQTTLIEQVMSPNPKTVPPNVLAVDALNIMEANKITSLMVVNDQLQLLGALTMHDMLRAGVV